MKKIYEDLAFSEDSLDKAWQEQPSLYMSYAEEVALARKAEDELKERLVQKEAELSLAIRNNPEAFGIAKITEGTVKDAVLVHADRLAIVEALTRAKYERDVLQGAVIAFEHRKKALENMVSLSLCGFYSQPKISGTEGQILKNLNEEI